MCNFMGKDIEKLQEENLELKLSALKNIIDVNNKNNKLEHEQIMGELREILQHVKKTNGSVAKVTERLIKLEQDKAVHMEDFNTLKDTVHKEREETKLWRTISSNKWVLTLILVMIYILGSNTFRDVLLNLITKIR